jgi:hypothetical protein
VSAAPSGNSMRRDLCFKILARHIRDQIIVPVYQAAQEWHEYEANGGHPIPGRDQVDFAAMARAAGYRRADTIATLDDFEAKIAGLLVEAGPVFVALKLVAGPPPSQDYGFIHGAPTRAAFKAALRQS